MLRKPEIETGVELRTQWIERCIRNCLASIVEADRKIRAPLESLIVSKISSSRVQRRSRAESTGRQDAVVVDLQCAGENRVETGDDRAAAQSRLHQAA